MAILYRHRDDHAAIQVSDELTWDTAGELVSTVDTLVDAYCYEVIELVVSSPGGSTHALNHVLEALHTRRGQGLRVRTRVNSLAQSAAALLVCSADERVAAPSAQLLFHATHASPGQSITASETSAFLGSLQQTDEGVLDFLVTQVLGTASPGDRIGAARSDRAVLETLSRACPRPKRRPRGVAALVRLIAETIDRAVEADDRVALTRLYRRLLAADQPISARLALTLRLIDAIGSPTAHASKPDPYPGPIVPEWRRLFPPDGYVPRELLTRHILVLGETGAGKTLSGVAPLLCLLATALPRDVGTGLVIDPKGELALLLGLFKPERIAHLRADTLVLDLMAGPRWSIEADLAAGRWLTAAHRILSRVASLVPSSPARVVGPHVVTDANTEFFDREGTALAKAILAFVLMTTAPDAPAPATWLTLCPEGLRCMEALLERARGNEALRGPNALALTAWILESRLVAPPGARILTTGDYGGTTPPPGWLLAHVAAEARRVFAAASPEARDLIGALTEYWPSMAAVHRQYAGVRASASVLCGDFAVPLIARTLYFGCEAGLRAGAAHIPDFARAVSPRIGGPLFVFQPARGRLDLVAVALKALLFEAVFDDPERALGHPGLPLVCYAADEFQHFATSDPVHGEQGLLCAARSLGVTCLLACQSLASIEHALAAGGGTAEQNRTSVALLWTNTATKLVFRTTDPSTIDRVAALCPHRPGLAPVVQVRPLSTLAPGECYAALPDGRFERRQLAPSRLLLAMRNALAVPDPEPAPSSESPESDNASSEVIALPGPSAQEPEPAEALPDAEPDRDVAP